jgi:hypothetical protein
MRAERADRQIGAGHDRDAESELFRRMAPRAGCFCVT